MPEIRSGQPSGAGAPCRLTIVPMLASIGCPYRCDFCVDWNNAYLMLPADRLAGRPALHLRAPARGRSSPSTTPTSRVKFDQVLDLIEQSRRRRNPYIMESSLSILRGDRLQPAAGDRTASTSRPASSHGRTTRTSPASGRSVAAARSWSRWSSSSRSCTSTCRASRRTSSSARTATRRGARGADQGVHAGACPSSGRRSTSPSPSAGRRSTTSYLAEGRILDGDAVRLLLHAAPGHGRGTTTRWPTTTC